MNSNKTTNRITELSQSNAAIIAGIGLLIMTIAAIFAEFFVRQNLIVDGDAAATASNISADETRFRIAIFCYLIVIVMDVMVAWALYVFFKPVDENLSLLAGGLRVIYLTLFAMSVSNLVTVLGLLSGADYLDAFETDQLNAQVMLALNAFDNGWAIGFVFFGLHLGLLGYLALRSDDIPQYMGILLMIAGFGYLHDNLSFLLLPDYSVEIGMVTFIGELLLMVWLLIKGSKFPEPHKEN